MREIKLEDGEIARIDDEYIDLVSRYRWHSLRLPRLVYAVAYSDGVQILMHRLIMGPRSGQIVDHIDSDGLNNTRSNLRFANHAENMRNRRKTVNATSRFKGVWFEAKKWRACLRVNGKRIRAGYFVSEEEAARAYDALALKHHGRFARLNFDVRSTIQAEAQ